MSSPGKEGLSTEPLTVSGTTVWDSLLSFQMSLQEQLMSTAGKLGRSGGRGRKIFCIITTFRKAHALKGNIFSLAFDPWAAYYTQAIRQVCLLFPHSLPFFSLPPHTLKKFVSKRPAFLIALNYPAMVFLYFLYRLDHRCLGNSETSVSD